MVVIREIFINKFDVIVASLKSTTLAPGRPRRKLKIWRSVVFEDILIVMKNTTSLCISQWHKYDSESNVVNKGFWLQAYR